MYYKNIADLIVPLASLSSVFLAVLLQDCRPQEVNIGRLLLNFIRYCYCFTVKKTNC